MVRSSPQACMPMTPDDETILRRAIAERRLVEFLFQGCVRIAEPHDYGVRQGKTQLLAFQVAGESKSGALPNWRWIDLAHASSFRLLEQTFAGGRPTPSGKHSPWEKLFLRVKGR